MKKSYFSLEEALVEGFSFHSFRSGGGLRVLTLSKGDDDADYYGEGPSYKVAMRILLEDLAAGGRKYKDVYGPLEPRFLTGAFPKENDEVDKILYQGRNIDAKSDGELIKVTIKQLLQLRTPKQVCDIVTTEKKEVRWKRVVTSDVFVSTPCKFANDEIGTSTRCEAEKHDWMPEIKLIGKDLTFEKALDKAILNGAEKVRDLEKFIILQ